MKNTVKLLVFSLLIFILSGCTISHNFGQYTGKVVDAETGEPLVGAGVYLEFFSKSPSPGGAVGQTAGIVECLTDKNGEFRLSARINHFGILQIWDSDPIVLIFKPGYGAFPDHKGSSASPHREYYPHIESGTYFVIRLPKLKTDKERRENLSNLFYQDTPLNILKRVENEERIHLGLKPYQFKKNHRKKK